MRLPDDVNEWGALLVVVIAVLGACFVAVVAPREDHRPPCKKYESRSMLFPHRIGQVTVMIPMDRQICVER